MKGLLPTLAVCIILAMVFFSRGDFAPALPEGVEFDPGEIDLTGSGVRMVSPLLTGLDNENRRFEVTAVSAEQDAEDPGAVNLEGINGSMQLSDGGWVTLDAVGGQYNSETNMLSLRDAIEVTTSAGYVARLNGAEVDFKKGEVATTNPVVVYMDAGVITGNAMTMYHNERLVRFTDGVTMTINGDPRHEGSGQ